MMSDTPIGRVRGMHEPPVSGDSPPPPASAEAAAKTAPMPAESATSPDPALLQPPTAAPRPARPAGPVQRSSGDGPRPRRPQDVDAEIDRELEQTFGRPLQNVAQPSLKRQWDDGLEAELEAALEGFDADSIRVPRPNTGERLQRSDIPKGKRGQESREEQQPQKAKVVAIRGDDVFLDLGAKSEGIVPVSQFEGKLPEVGQVIDVMFDRFDNEEGLLVMSIKGAAVHATWQNLREGMIVEAKVVKETKGGLQVEVDGIRGFMPISQIDLNRVEDAKVYVNEKLKAIVTEANQRERNLVVSRRDLLEQERAEKREKTWAELEEGQTRDGIVRSVKDFGAFVDLGGVDGLIHVSDLAWSRGIKPQDVVKPGDLVQVKVLKIDRDTRKVGLGLKQLAASPWDDIEDRFGRGQTVTGKVTRLMDFGAFVELEPGIEGLIHISEMASKRVFRVKDHVQVDQEVEVRILDIDPEAKRISLSIKPVAAGPAPEPEPQDDPDAPPPPPRPERKVPLKGGLGDRDPNPFGSRKD
jgi:small subunit ribosomal protein S1